MASQLKQWFVLRVTSQRSPKSKQENLELTVRKKVKIEAIDEHSFKVELVS